MSISKVTRNYQITLPPEVRLLQQIRVGDKVVFAVEDGKIHLFKIKKDALEAAFGIWGKGPSGKVTQKKLRAEWNKREQAP
ncbi:MAG: AbrB/MazE/SpoVT family DNA-binding domain-containing protein [Patescibacteria group bacterium]